MFILPGSPLITSCPPMNSSVKGDEKTRTKEASRLAKDVRPLI